MVKILFLFLAHFGAYSYAIEVKVPSQAYLNEPLRLQFLSSTKNIQIKKFPQLPCFKKKYIPPSTQTHLSPVFLEFTLYPQQLGSCPIDSLEAIVDGTLVKTKELSLEILPIPESLSTPLEKIDLIGENQISSRIVNAKDKQKQYVNTIIEQQFTFMGDGDFSSLILPSRPYSHPHVRYYPPKIQLYQEKEKNIYIYTYRFLIPDTLRLKEEKYVLRNLRPSTLKVEEFPLIFPSLEIRYDNTRENTRFDWDFFPKNNTLYSKILLPILILVNLCVFLIFLFLAFRKTYLHRQSYWDVLLPGRRNFYRWMTFFYTWRQEFFCFNNKTIPEESILQSIDSSALSFAPAEYSSKTAAKKNPRFFLRFFFDLQRLSKK